jgi:YggT family protein
MSALLVLPLAVSRGDIAHYVNTVLDVYIVLIFIRILMSWVPRVPYYRWLDALLGFVREVTDPYLNFFRRFLPVVRIGGGGLDLSPMVGVFVLIIVGEIVVSLIRG